MRRYLLPLVAVAFLVPASPAAAQTVKTNFVEGFLYWIWTNTDDGYRYRSLNAYDLDPGTRLRVGCADAAAPCAFTPGERTVGAGRQTSLGSILGSAELTAADRVLVTATNPDGRRLDLTLQMKGGEIDLDSTCQLPDGSPSPCVVDCPVAEPRPATQPCAAVTRRPRAFGKALGVSWFVDWDSRGNSLFKDYVLHDLPSGTSVYLICVDPKTGLSPCNRPVAYYPPAAPGRALDLDLTSLIRGRRLPPGTRVTVRLRKPGYRVQQLRFTTRKFKRPIREKLCLDPGRPQAHRC